MRDALADAFHRFQRQAVQRAAALRPGLRQQGALAQRIAAEHKAAIQARCAMAYGFGFQQGHIALAAFGQ